MKVFGPLVPPEAAEIKLVSIPVGQSCAHCKETIANGDSGYVIMHMGIEVNEERPYHRACFLRGIFGSVAHQRGECSCFDGDHEDDPNLSARENAKASERYFLLHPPKDPE